MEKLFLFFLILVFTSCSNEPKVLVKWGCDTSVKAKNWLSFKYDKAVLYTDSSGSILKAFSDHSFEKYTDLHAGKTLNYEDIKGINDALSCRMWTCQASQLKDKI